MRKLTAAGLGIIGLLLTPTVASAQLCGIALMVSAAYVGMTEKRELTTNEALTCGLIREKPVAEKPKKKRVAKRSKHPA